MTLVFKLQHESKARRIAANLAKLPEERAEDDEWPLIIVRRFLLIPLHILSLAALTPLAQSRPNGFK